MKQAIGVDSMGEEGGSWSAPATDEITDEEKSGPRLASSFPYLVTAISTLITALSISILAFWLLSDENSIFGGPPATLVAWQKDYESMTGMDGIPSSLDGTGVTICVVDSGVNLDHPGLQGVEIVGWYDAVNGKPEPYDDQGHGTAMLGIISAREGIGGISVGADLLVAKGIDESGTGTDDGIAEAVDWCVASGADVVSLSLGGDQGPGLAGLTLDVLESSVQEALDQGVFVVAAAGNDGTNDDGDVASPGSVSDVICVGGVNRNGDVWSGSSRGDNNGRLWPNPILPRQDPDRKPEVIAPASEVPVLLTNAASWYGYSSGTSAATAWVSGVIALALENEPQMARSGDRTYIEELKQRISESSTPKEGQTGHDDRFGYGILYAPGIIETNTSEGESAIHGNDKHADHDAIITTRVAPDNSTKAELNPRSAASRITRIQSLNESTLSWAGVNG